MTQGFDEWFKKKFKDLHEAICCGDLVANNYKKAIKKGFNAGAASRQVEIDELKAELETLQGMHNAASLYAGKLIDERDELQKRIDEALSELDEAYKKGIIEKPRVIVDSIKILKGKKDE